MLTGVILAGGTQNESNEKAKSFESYKDEKIIQRQIRHMNQICQEIILVTKTPMLYVQEVGQTIRIISDFYEAESPLSGMHAAFSLAKYKTIWVVANDMPLISTEAAKVMWEHKVITGVHAVIPYVGDKVIPYHGIYDKSCIQYLDLLLSTGEEKMQDFLDVIEWQQVNDLFFHMRGIEPSFDKTI